MNSELWQCVRRHLDELMSLAVDQREQRLARLRETDPEIAREVETRLSRQLPPTPEFDATGSTAWPEAEWDRTRPEGANPTEGMPERVGRYEVVELVGRGGMGAVYRVRDTLFRRSLALKILAAEHGGDPDLRGRFLEEAQLMGQLQHPGIPPVHDLGEMSDGRPYFTMKLIRGQTLAQLLEKRSGVEQDQPRLLGIFEQVCATLAYAHAQGVIHRDLKPANIMVGAFGEVQVMDWGLGKVRSAPEKNPARESVICTMRSESPDAATLAGATMGTPAYMAPEQARGEVDSLDERCDVFGLGAILCEILTGEPPFGGWNVHEVLRHARQGDVAPALARLSKSGADADLVALTTRCLATNRQDRPASAAEIHHEVTAYMNSVQQRLRQAELARKEADIRAAEKQKRRRTAYRFGTVIAALLLALVAGGGWIRHVRAEREHQNSMVRQGLEARFDEVDRVLASGKAQEAKEQLDKIRPLLLEMQEADFERRLADREEDLGLLVELDALFGRRWQVMQQVVLEHVHSGERGKGLALGQPRLDSDRYTRGATEKEMRGEYAATFGKYGLDPTQSSAEDVIRRVKGSIIRKGLIDALEQWFLLEPQSKPLLDVLDALDEKRAVARQMLAQRGAGKTVRGDMAALEKDDPEPIVVMYLSELLPDDRAIPLLKGAVRRHPDDYRLLTVLVYRLLLMRPTRTERAEEATGYALAAHALKPENSFACLMVAIALKAAGKLDEAIRQGHRAVELDGKHAAAHHHLALAYSKNKQLDEAVKWWKKTVILDPKHHGAHCNLGWSHSEKKEYAEAIKLLSRAIVLDEKCAVAHRNLGYAYKQNGQPDEAIKSFRRAIDLDPQQVWAYSNLGWTYNGKKEYGEAVKWLEKAVALDPKHLLAHRNLGDSYYGQKRYAKAIESYKKAITIGPNDAVASNKLGLAYKLNGQLDEAVKWFRKAIDLDPKHVYAHTNLGWTYIGKNDCNEAIKWLEKAIEIDPKHVLAYYNMGVALNGKKEPDEAIEWFSKAIALDPRHRLSLNEMGNTYYSRKQYDEAIKWYRKVTDLDPKHVNANYNLGLAYQEKKEYVEAVKWFGKTIVLAPKHVLARRKLGDSYYEQKQYARAIEWYKKATALAPKDADALNKLGLAYKENNQPDEAIKCFREIVEFAPKHVYAHNNLGWTYIEKKEYDEAIEWLEKAIALDPKFVLAHYNMGVAYNGKDNRDRAIEWLEKAIALDPRYVDAHFLLGFAYLSNGQHDEAIKSYRKVIDLDPKNILAHKALGLSYSANKDYGQAIEWCRKALVLDPKEVVTHLSFIAALAGDKRPKEAVEAVEVARRVIAKADWPMLRYNAACAYALAGCGSGDATKITPAERSRLLKQCLAWLREELGEWAALAKKADADSRKAAAETLRHVLADDDFVGVRDAKAMQSLAADERKLWQEFWQDVRKLLATVEPPTKGP